MQTRLPRFRGTFTERMARERFAHDINAQIAAEAARPRSTGQTARERLAASAPSGLTAVERMRWMREQEDAAEAKLSADRRARFEARR